MSKFSSFKVPKILYIHGVFLEDCKQIGDVLEERLMEENNNELEVGAIIHKKLPHIYRGADSWVKKCNIKCFYCDRFFETVPLFIPKSIEKNNNGGFNMQREECFDLWPCVIRRIEIKYPKYSVQQEKINMVLFLYEDMTGRKLTSIPGNIDKYEMDCYEGDVAPSDWGVQVEKLMLDAEKAAGYHKKEMVAEEMDDLMETVLTEHLVDEM